jgi:hypothetical protein
MSIGILGFKCGARGGGGFGFWPYFDQIVAEQPDPPS